MQEDTTLGSTDLPQTADGPNASPLPGSAESTQPPSDPGWTAAADHTSTGPSSASSPKLPDTATLLAVSTHPVDMHSDGRGAKPVVKWKGIEEVVRTSASDITSFKPVFEAVEGSEANIRAIMHRAESVRSPMTATPVPTGTAVYGTTDDLFLRLQEAIAVQASLGRSRRGLATVCLSHQA